MRISPVSSYGGGEVSRAAVSDDARAAASARRAEVSSARAAEAAATQTTSRSINRVDAQNEARQNVAENRAAVASLYEQARKEKIPLERFIQSLKEMIRAQIDLSRAKAGDPLSGLLVDTRA